MSKHRAYGYTIGDNEKKKSYLTKFSKHCRFNGKSKDFIVSGSKKYLSSIITSETVGIGKLMTHLSRKCGKFWRKIIVLSSIIFFLTKYYIGTINISDETATVDGTVGSKKKLVKLYIGGV